MLNLRFGRFGDQYCPEGGKIRRLTDGGLKTKIGMIKPQRTPGFFYFGPENKEIIGNPLNKRAWKVGFLGLRRQAR